MLRSMKLRVPYTCRAFAALLLLVACSGSPTSPNYEVAPIFIRLAALDDLSTYWDTTRSFVVLAEASDTTTPLPLNVRIPATVSTSSGDVEQMLLARRVCDGDLRSCHVLGVGLQTGADLVRLATDLDRQGARLGPIAGSGFYGSVFVFEPGDVDRVSKWLAARHEVRYVEPSSFAVCGIPSMCPTDLLFVQVTGAVRLRELTGSPTPMDNHLEVNPGDSITVAIHQPDGSSFEFTEVAWPWGTGGVVGAQ